MKKKTALTKMHIAPSTVCYDAVAARDSNEVGLILAAVRKRNGYSLVTFSELLRHYGVDVSDKGISKWEKGYTTPSIYQLVAICHALNIKEGPSYFTKTFQKPALLNAIGQKKVAEYEMDLIASRRYQPGTEAVSYTHLYAAVHAGWRTDEHRRHHPAHHQLLHGAAAVSYTHLSPITTSWARSWAGC